MDLTKHEEVMQLCKQKSVYFENLEFPHLAESFGKAAESLSELITKIKEIENDGTATE